MQRQTTHILLVEDEMTCLHTTAPPYDFLRADLDMPWNRELGLIRASQRISHSVSVIVLMGSPSVVTAVQSLHLAVVVAALIKPVDVTALLYCVGPAVETRRFWRVGLQAYGEM